MVTSSAPGKVYLFGEHAVVYGEPAVPCAIERRARVTAEQRDDDKLRVNATDLTLDGFTVEYDGSVADTPDIDVAEPLLEEGMGYVNQAIEQARDAAGAQDVGFDVTVQSAIPLGAGLGSSAAVVNAAIDAATRELGVELDPREIADRAYRVEYEVQDGQASRADTFCSAMGGAVRVEGDDCRQIPDVPNLPFVVGYDGGSGDTGKLVAGVRDLREEYGFAADTVEAIGDRPRGRGGPRSRRPRRAGRADELQSRPALGAGRLLAVAGRDGLGRPGRRRSRRETHWCGRRWLYRRARSHRGHRDGAPVHARL